MLAGLPEVATFPCNAVGGEGEKSATAYHGGRSEEEAPPQTGY